MNPGRSPRLLEWTGRACLLAWLVLAWGGPAPAPCLTGTARPVESWQEESAPEDAPPIEDESGQDAGVAPRSLLKRVRGPAPAPEGPEFVRSPRVGRDRVVLGAMPGHFLADGRSLRLWLRSLTC